MSVISMIGRPSELFSAAAVAAAAESVWYRLSASFAAENYNCPLKYYTMVAATWRIIHARASPHCMVMMSNELSYLVSC